MIVLKHNFDKKNLIKNQCTNDSKMIKQLELDDLIRYGKLFLKPDMIVKNKIFPKN